MACEECGRLTSSRASVASLSASSEPGSTRSPSAKRSATAEPCSQSAGPGVPALSTSTQSTQTDWIGSAPSTSSQAACPASPQASPEADADEATSAGYGPRSLKLFDYLAPRGHWRRILSDSLASNLTGWRGLSGHFESSVSMRGPSSSPLTTWVPHILDDESGLLPTPTATSYGSTNNGKRGDGTTYKTAGTPSLETMARKNLWPTPTAGDAKSSGSRNTESSSAHFGLSLTDAVRQDGGQGRLIPTPSANDWKGSSKPGQRRRQLTDPAMGVIPQGGGGDLNPTFCEWLMGFPLAWTVLEPSEMPASRRSSKRSGTRSSKPTGA
jgi:hypothetical protein